MPENLPVVEQVIEPSEVIEQPEQWRFIGRMTEALANGEGWREALKQQDQKKAA